VGGGKGEGAAGEGQSVGDGEDTSFSQSDALSFASFRRGEVDSRTGSFNYRVPIARLTGNQMRGPTIELHLSYDHFSQRDEGFGKGWSLNLSKFIDNNSRKKVLLRDGRIIDLKLNEDTETYEPETVDLKDFKLTKLDSPEGAYQILYKDGTAETIAPVDTKKKLVYLTEITHENGYKIYIEYSEVPAIGACYIKRIYDDYETDLTCPVF
jgi:hypothetical protein